MMKMILPAALTAGLAAALASPAGASIAPGGTTTLPIQPPGASPAAVAPNSMCDLPEGTNPQLCVNDSGYGCTASTPVVGWQETNTSNEAVYFTAQSSGYYNIHFKSCGNAWCIWQYGFGTSGNYLYLHACDGGSPDDLFGATEHSTYDTIENPYANGPTGYMGVGTTQGDQVFTSTYTAGYSDWLFYTQ